MFPSVAPAVCTDLFGNVFIKGGKVSLSAEVFFLLHMKLPSNHLNTQQIHPRLTERLRLS